MTITTYNSLSKKVEAFIPLSNDEVKLYACGPTVYDFITIGNFRTFALADVVFRTLKYNDYNVKFIMNLTDVGHLTGDNLGDADIGDDKLEKAAEKSGKSAREVADYYIKDFLTTYEKLNLTKPNKFTRASEYIKQQVDLVKQLEAKGYTYKTSDGVYFDTSKFSSYGQMSGLKANEILEGARVEPNPEKRNATDFALWKFSPKEGHRWQEWPSPWGVGFPGWHLECSAMAISELGESIDIHIGGEDLKMIHHQNEIAQSEAATGKVFAKYWMHGAFLQVDGGKMGKSLGNAYTLSDITSKGYLPLSLRYFYMTAHYRSPLNFTWTNLQAAENALKKLYGVIEGYEYSEKAGESSLFVDKFIEAVNSDYNMPKALSVVWDLIKSDVPEASKLATLLNFDEVLGFGLADYVGVEIPAEINDLARTRDMYRKSGIWDKADQVRHQIEAKGYTVEDKDTGFKIKKKL